MANDYPSFEQFKQLATSKQGEAESGDKSGGSRSGGESGGGGHVLVPMYRELLSDQLTPVLAYRRLVRPDARMAPSFLLESVVGGDRIGRYSFMGAQPIIEIVAKEYEIKLIDRINNDNSRTFTSDDPLSEMDRITCNWKLAEIEGLPDFTGGWVGYAGYDTIRYLEGEKLSEPPTDDRNLADMQMALYRQIVAFDHVRKTVLAITHVLIDEHDTLQAAYAAGQCELDSLVSRIETPWGGNPKGRIGAELSSGNVNLKTPPPKLDKTNMPNGGYQNAVRKVKEYILAGDAFQVVISQRFEMETAADPFDIYRALRVVNPSPYMFYAQIEGGMLIGSSPEILCRVKDGMVTNRPLAGTRHRGQDIAEDQKLEQELLADPKDRSEHIMLVDLGRNDVGRVAQPGSVELSELMSVERYSHVMHISSTVQGQLQDGFNCWDALRYTLPVGTVSGAPKVRAMQIIDELEMTRRGPYAGAVGYADFAGNLDMCIALRTMVVMPADEPDRWTVHIQAGAGLVADSDPDSEHQETVNKAAALAKAVDIAEKAFNGE